MDNECIEGECIEGDMVFDAELWRKVIEDNDVVLSDDVVVRDDVLGEYDEVTEKKCVVEMVQVIGNNFVFVNKEENLKNLSVDKVDYSLLAEAY